MRAGTRAARMKGQIPEQVKEERLAELAALDAKMRRRFEQSWDGSEVEVLFEEAAQIDEHGFVCTPNSGQVRNASQDLVSLQAPGKGTIYTGYTREYIRVFACSEQDLRGKTVTGKLKGLVIQS